MKIANIEQGTKEWHDFRRQGIGSSDITVLLGSYPFKKKTRLSLFEEKTTYLIDYEDSPAMAYGRIEEAKALEYLRKHEPDLAPSCAIHSDYDFARCSFDALGKDSFYEIKSPYSLEILEKALMGDLQAYWEDQVRWQMLVSGLLKGHVAVWDGSTAHIFEIKKDLEWEAHAIKIAQEFWNDVAAGQRPEATDEDYLPVLDEKCSASLEKYCFWAEKEKESKKNKDLAKVELIDGGPGHNFIVDGVKVYQTQSTSYDFEKMRADGINVDLYKKTSRPYWMISPKKVSSKKL